MRFKIYMKGVAGELLCGYTEAQDSSEALKQAKSKLIVKDDTIKDDNDGNK